MRSIFLNRLIIVIVAMSFLFGCKNSDQRAEEREKFGIELFEKGEFSKAKLEFASALKGDGTLATTYYYLSLINEKEGNYLAMKENLKHAIKFDPENIEAHNKLGKVYLLFNELDSALIEVDEILKLSNDSLSALALKSAIYVKQKKHKEALSIIDYILQKQPDYLEAISLKVAILMYDKKFDDALLLVEPVIESGTKDISIHLLKIQLDAKLHNNDGVIAGYEKLTEMYPEKFEFKLTLAKIYSQANRKQDAESLLRRIVDSTPKEILPKFELLNFLHGVDKNKVVEQVKKFGSESEMDLEILFQISQWLLEKQYLSEAEFLLEKVGNLAESSDLKQRANLLLAKVAFHSVDIEKSKKIVDELLDKNSENLAAKILKAKIFIVQEQYDEALALLKKFLWVEPNSDEALVLLAQVEIIRGFPEKADKKFREALVVNPANMSALNSVITRSLGSKDIDYASGLITKAIDIQPNNLNLLKQATEIKILGRDWDGAKEILKSIERQPQGKLITKFLNGRINQEQGDCIQAISIFKEVLQVSPAYPDALRQMATCYEIVQKRAEMIEYMVSFKEKNPRNILAFLVMGQLYLLEENDDKAIETYNGALKIDEKRPQTYAALAGVYNKQNNYEKAIETYKKGLELNPNNVRLTIYLASVYETINEYQNAVELYESLLELEPRLEIAINNYASLLVDAYGDKASIEKARQLVKKFNNSDNPFYLDSYAWTELKSGNIENAISVLEKVNVMAETAVFKYHLGMAYFEQGNKAGALANLQQAVDLGKQRGDFNEIENARRFIEKITKGGR